MRAAAWQYVWIMPKATTRTSGESRTSSANERSEWCIPLSLATGRGSGNEPDGQRRTPAGILEGMDDDARKLASERLRMGIQLSDAVLIMRRQRIKRDNPGRSAREVDDLLNAELRNRPMDGEGVVIGGATAHQMMDASPSRGT